MWRAMLTLTLSLFLSLCVFLSPQLARTLIEFESLWFQAWERSTDTAKKGLRAKLIVQDAPSGGVGATAAGSNGNGKLHVNFDQGVLQLMREAKHLSLMGFDIPNSARVVLLLEDKLKSYVSDRHTHTHARARAQAHCLHLHFR